MIVILRADEVICWTFYRQFTSDEPEKSVQQKRFNGQGRELFPCAVLVWCLCQRSQNCTGVIEQSWVAENLFGQYLGRGGEQFHPADTGAKVTLIEWILEYSIDKSNYKVNHKPNSNVMLQTAATTCHWQIEPTKKRRKTITNTMIIIDTTAMQQPICNTLLIQSEEEQFFYGLEKKLWNVTEDK